MHEIFFLSDILFTSCYFTCTCLVLEISLFGSIVVKINSKVFHIWHSDPYMDRLHPITRVYVRCHGRKEIIIVSNPGLEQYASCTVGFYRASKIIHVDCFYHTFTRAGWHKVGFFFINKTQFRENKFIKINK